MSSRRRFLVKAGGVLATAGAAVSIDAPNVIAQPRMQWRMPTMWSPANDVLQNNANVFAKTVENVTGGRFTIKPFVAGELMPATGVFDGCANGSVEMYNGGSYYWAGKEPAMQWFTGLPFGLNADGYYAWFNHDDGTKLMEEVYAPFGLVPRPGTATNPQMMGWFRKKLNSVDDLKGLKIRIPGIGGKVYASAGSAVVLLPPGEIYTALERGTIDAVEFVGPHDDMKLGFHQVARYYYYPGWQETTSVTEFTFNKKAYDALPVDFKRALDAAALATQVLSIGEYTVKNSIAMKKLLTEHKGKVEVTRISDALLEQLRKLAAQATQQESEKNALTKKVSASYARFQALTGEWSKVSEGGYYSLIQT
jgi:TRAP-type mannitol/chloroaromatic compound transport system substrate-binding protein